MAVQGRIVSSEPNSSNTRRWPGVDRLPGLFSSNYTRSVAAQGLVSGFHFGLNLVLLRLITPYEYGIFAFAFVLAMFAAAVNNALISTPLTVYTPIVKDSDERARQEAMFSTLNLALFLALVVAGALYAWWLGLRQDIAVGVTVFVAVYSARQFSRSFGYAKLRPLVTASGDGAYVLSGGIIIALLVYTGGRVPVGHILLALAAANLVAMLVERLRLHGRQKRWFTIANVSGYAHIWLQSRWALIGALTTLFLAQAHSVIITWVDGPTAYAPLAAGFVLFGPVRVALMTWQNMVKPELAMALENQQQQAVRAQIGRTSVLMGAAVIVLGIIMAIAWPLLYELLYAKQYADEPMAFIVMIWAVITFFAAIYNAPSAALQAMRDFKVLAMGSIYGAGISGLLVCLLLYLQKPEHTLFGILAAELFMAIYLTRLLLGRLKA